MPDKHFKWEQAGCYNVIDIDALAENERLNSISTSYTNER